MDGEFAGKRVVVTGAGKGIGKALVFALHQKNAKIHAISRTQSDLEKLQQELEGICTYCLDISDWNKTKEIVKSIGDVDMLVNNAGIYLNKELFVTDKSDIDRVFHTNLYAAYNIAQTVAKSMVDAGHGGSIVNISSDSSIKATAGDSVYCMSKAAMDMMTKCLAVELGKHKIRVNSVNPQLVRTAMGEKAIESTPNLLEHMIGVTPLGRIPETSDVVDVTLFLLSKKSSMVTGSHIPVDGGSLLS